MGQLDDTPGWPTPVGVHYHVLSLVFLLAAGWFLKSGLDCVPSRQTPLFIGAGTCLICMLLCRVIVAIKRLEK